MHATHFQHVRILPTPPQNKIHTPLQGIRFTLMREEKMRVGFFADWLVSHQNLPYRNRILAMAHGIVSDTPSDFH